MRGLRRGEQPVWQVCTVTEWRWDVTDWYTKLLLALLAVVLVAFVTYAVLNHT